MAMDYECEIEIMEGEDKLLILCGSGFIFESGSWSDGEWIVRCVD